MNRIVINGGCYKNKNKYSIIKPDIIVVSHWHHDHYNMLNTFKNYKYVNVATIPHHGSKFIGNINNFVNNNYFVVPVGRNNRYNHPNNTILQHSNGNVHCTYNGTFKSFI